MPESSPRVSAIVVSYNVKALLRACLRSLEAAREAGELQEIIVVDSSSADDSVEMIAAEFPGIQVEVVPNRGYGAAANAGYRRAAGDFLLTLNPDTVVCPGAITSLATALTSNPGVGLVGPTLRYPNRTLQPSRRRFPTAWTPMFESTILEEWFPDNRWTRRYHMRDTGAPQQDTESVDWLVGAAFLARRAAIDATGGFDESFFLYGEELELCHRMRRHGWDVRYVPEATVIHHEAASTSQDRLGSRLQFDRGRVRAQCKVHGEHVARRTARLLRLHFGVQLAREGLKWIVGHRRDLRRRRIGQYWKLMRSRLDD